MSKGFGKRKVARIGYTPEAEALNAFTQTNLLRSGVHKCRGGVPNSEGCTTEDTKPIL